MKSILMTNLRRVIDEYLGKETKYIITDKKWNNIFDDAKKMNPNLTFVKPEWVLESHTKQKLVDMKPFVIKKT